MYAPDATQCTNQRQKLVFVYKGQI